MRLIAVITVLAFAWLAACSGTPEPASTKPTVVCTTVMVGDLVEEIAGDDLNVIVMFGATVDPHLFRPTRDDLKTLNTASLVFLSGFHLEGNMTAALKRLATADVRVISLAEEITSEDDLLYGDSKKAVDPHLWMDVALWSRATDVIHRELAGLLPSASESFRARADVLRDRLKTLDGFVADSIASIPENARILVTAHDAFQYFGRRYGVEVRAIQGISTASEAGMHQVNALVDLIVQKKVPAVFFESTISERNVKALVEGAGAQGHIVRVGGVLHSDAPGDAVSYEAMVRHNAVIISEALGGTLR